MKHVMSVMCVLYTCSISGYMTLTNQMRCLQYGITLSYDLQPNRYVFLSLHGREMAACFGEPMSDVEKVSLWVGAVLNNTKTTMAWGILVWASSRATTIAGNGIVRLMIPLLKIPTVDLAYWYARRMTNQNLSMHSFVVSNTSSSKMVHIVSAINPVN